MLLKMGNGKQNIIHKALNVLCFLRFGLANKFLSTLIFFWDKGTGALFRGKKIGTGSKLLIADNLIRFLVTWRWPPFSDLA